MLTERYKNTNFFHRITTRRRKNNQVLGLKSFDGSWVRDESKICDLLLSHFTNLFQENGNSNTNLPKLSNLPIAPISSSHQNLLNLPLQNKEIEDAVKSLALGKAPGPDEFSPEFFLQNWELIQEDIFKLITDLYNGKIEIIPSTPHYWSLSPKPKNQKPL